MEEKSPGKSQKENQLPHRGAVTLDLPAESMHVGTEWSEIFNILKGKNHQWRSPLQNYPSKEKEK